MSYFGYCNAILCLDAAVNLFLAFLPAFILIGADLAFLCWSILVMARFLQVISEPDKYWLNLFPAILYFLLLFMIGFLA